MNKLAFKCLQKLDGISAAELGRLFPEPSMSAPLLSLIQESGIDGFNLRSIVVLRDDAPILLLPLFETRFDLSMFTGGGTRILLRLAGRLVPSLFQPRVLCVGSVVEEWSEIGIVPQIDQLTRSEAFRLAFDALESLAAELRSDIIGLYNFNHYGNLPQEAFERFNRVQYRSCARLKIDFSSLDEYFSRLSRGARKDLRRKMRAAASVTVIRTRDVLPHIEKIYKLYLETVTRGTIALGRHKRIFFEKICERVPGAWYTLYFADEELVAFNLLFVTGETMVDKFFCMDQRLGRKYNLYVLSWLENIRTCMEQKIPLYYAGQGMEKAKAHMGAVFIPSFILFKHRRPALNRFLMAQSRVINKVLSFIGFWPDAEAFNIIAAKGETEMHDQPN